MACPEQRRRAWSERRVLACLLALLLAASAAWASEPVTGAFKGPNRALSAADLGAHPANAETYSESWGVVCALDDGGFLLLNMMVSNVGLGDDNPSYGLSYIDPQGKVIDRADFDVEFIEAARDRVRVRFEGLTLDGTHPEYVLRATAEGISLDARISAQAAPATAGDGLVSLGIKHYWRFQSLAPRGRIQGTLTLAGRPRPIAGWVYLDHAWSDLPMFEYSRNWLSARVHTPELSVDVFRFLPTENGGPIGVMLVRGPGIELTGARLSWSDSGQIADPQMGFHLPRRVSVESQIDGRSVRLDLELGPQLQALDGLQRLPAVQRTLAGVLIKHIGTYRYRAQYTLRVSGPQGELQQQGSCLVELLYFSD